MKNYNLTFEELKNITNDEKTAIKLFHILRELRDAYDSIEEMEGYKMTAKSSKTIETLNQYIEVHKDIIKNVEANPLLDLIK